MQIIAIVILILIGIKIEIEVYKKYILPHISYSCYFSKDEVMEGEKLEIIETVMNPSRFLLPCLKSEITTSNHLEFAENASTVDDRSRSLASLFSIHAKEKITRRWKVKALRRGDFKIEDITIVSSDLFGIYCHSHIIKVNSEVIVLPKPIEADNYVQRIQELQGERSVRRFILEDPFVIAGVREYTPRDSMNKIHWQLTARQGELMVRNDEATSKKSLTVIVNNQLYREQLKEAVNDERLEYVIKIAAGEIYKTIKGSVPVRLIANGKVEDEGTSLASTQMWGQAHVQELFRLLARLQTTFTEHFDKFLERYSNTICTTNIIIVTCYIDDAMIKFAHEKQQNGMEVKIYVLSYEADSIPCEDVDIYYLLDYLKETGEAG